MPKWEKFGGCFRIKTPDGWLFSFSSYKRETITCCYVPDKYHKWNKKIILKKFGDTYTIKTPDGWVIVMIGHIYPQCCYVPDKYHKFEIQRKVKKLEVISESG